MATFSGGARLQARLSSITKKLGNGGEVRAGFLEGVSYPEDRGGASLPMVAAIQEFGAPAAGIPPRPYFRPTIAQQGSAWGKVISDRIVKNDYDPQQVLGVAGRTMKEDIQDGIVAVNDPPLSDITLMLRKMRSQDQNLRVTGKVVGEAARRVAEGESIGDVNTKPLQDTGFMKANVDYQVK